MSFWQLNDGSKAESTTTFEQGGGEPIPDKTGCIAAIEEAFWDHNQKTGDEFITLKWRVAQPQAYANRVVFQKLKVFGLTGDKDPKATADKAKRMLAAIDTNAGGSLMKIDGKPTNTDLMSSLMGKMMAIKVMVWETDDGKKGNWISAVAPAKGAAAKPAQVQQAAPVDDDDSIPF